MWGKYSPLSILSRFKSLHLSFTTAPPSFSPSRSPPPMTFATFYRRCLRSVSLLSRADPEKIGEITSLQDYYRDWSLQHIIADGKNSIGNPRLERSLIIEGEKKRVWILQKYNVDDVLEPVLARWEEISRVELLEVDNDENTDDDDDDLFK